MKILSKRLDRSGLYEFNVEIDNRNVYIAHEGDGDFKVLVSPDMIPPVPHRDPEYRVTLDASEPYAAFEKVAAKVWAQVDLGEPA